MSGVARGPQRAALVAVAVHCVLAASACGARKAPTAPPTAPLPSCIAVLGFSNFTDVPGAGDLIPDLLATELYRSGRFDVMERSEAQRILALRGIYSSEQLQVGHADQIGAVLGVQAVLVGTVTELRYERPVFAHRPPRATVGFNVRLVDVRTGRALYSATFHRSRNPFFSTRMASLHHAGQRAAHDAFAPLASAAVLTRGTTTAPCWTGRSMSVLATLPNVVQTPVAAATATPVRKPEVIAAVATPVASPPPTVALQLPVPPPNAGAKTVPLEHALPPPKPLTPAQKLLLGKLRPNAVVPLLDDKAFRPNSDVLSPGALGPLTDLAAVLSSSPDARITIEVHVDATDPSAVVVSQRRAENVLQQLIALGSPPAAAEAKGLGSTKPLVPSLTAPLKARNRRVEVRVVEAPVVAPVPAVVRAPRIKVISHPKAGLGGILVVNSLKKSGLQVVKVVKTSSPPSATTVAHTPGAKAEAQRIAGMISVPGGTTLIPMAKPDPDAEIVVTLGASLK